MRGRRGWFVAAVLLLLGAAAGAGAVHEHWLPCRGSMLSGSILRGHAYGPDFGETCLQAMDDGFALVWPDGKDPWRLESVLGTVCALLLALAWAVVVLSSSWSWPTTVLAGLPAVASAAAALVSLSGAHGDAVDSAFTWLTLSIDAFAVVAFVAIGVREEPGRTAMWPVALALLASTAAGFFPNLADHVLMTGLSDANWDTPPGTGYPTVAAIALLAIALLVLTASPRPPRATSTRDPAGANAGT